MKIAQITAFPETRPGGSQAYCFELSKRLQARGHEVRIFTSDAPGNGREVSSARNLNVDRAPSHGNLWGINPLVSIFPRIVKEDYDVIHAHSYLFFTSLQAGLAGLVRRTPTLLHLHGGLESFAIQGSRATQRRLLAKKWFFDKTLGRWIMSVADVIASVSKFDLRTAETVFGADPKKLVYVPNAVDTDRFPLRTPSNGENATISFVGRLEYWKGADVFLRIAKSLFRRRKDVRALAAGGGSLAPEFLRAASEFRNRF